MSCAQCTQLESALESAERLDSPERLEGLTLIGERNREHQYRERVAKAMMLLQRHKAQCPQANTVLAGSE